MSHLSALVASTGVLIHSYPFGGNIRAYRVATRGNMTSGAEHRRAPAGSPDGRVITLAERESPGHWPRIQEALHHVSH